MGNPTECKSASAAPSATPSGGPTGRPRCQHGDQCFRKNLDHQNEFSHPSDHDWGFAHDALQIKTQEGYPTGEAPIAPYPSADGVAVEDRGLLGAAGGAAAAWGGMKVTGADSKMGFLGKAGLIVGAAVAGSMLEGHIKKGKKGKKSKKDKKSKSRELNVGGRDLTEEDSDSDSSSSGEEPLVQASKPPSGPSATVRPRCEFGEKCFRKNPDHRKEFSHPGDLEWSGP